jgi:hypothetical protein
MESSGSAGGATQQVQEVGGQAQEKAQEVVGQAQEKVQEVAGQARGQLRSQVDQRSTQAGEQVSTTAHDIRTVADELRKQDKQGPARIAGQAADRVERVGSYLVEADADRLLVDVESFGRRQPLAIAFAGFAAGFLASRFLKASSSQRYQQAWQPPRDDLGGSDPHALTGNGAGATEGPRQPTSTPGATS